MQGRDAIAGLSIAGLMLPEAIAYAGIAGLPPQRAILAAIAGACAYLILGRSRFAIISPTSSSAIDGSHASRRGRHNSSDQVCPIRS
ncbi:SulP family inorganic anion transporter [Sphingobium sp. SJ10-10]|uniref:SulP family inorganic anion transporter n=1 Tax=Sphingobium sp. SJ10-10 TaxID=3114999 RepID=UPI002E1748E2|nr:SulP family inorganic anion transporter [Sphingobium sp. SJ10-10]